MFDLQDFLSSCKRVVGAPDGAKNPASGAWMANS